MATITTKTRTSVSKQEETQLQTDPNWHQQEAMANKQRADDLFQKGDHGWAVVLLFYAALHQFDAVLGEGGVQTNSHEAQDEAIAAHPQSRIALADYQLLRSASIAVRYQGATLGYKGWQWYQTIYDRVATIVLGTRQGCLVEGESDLGD